MDFELGEDQAMLKESLNRLLADHYGFETRRALAREPRGWSSGLWARLAQLGVLGATFAEADGGLGGGPEDALVIGEALGAVLSAEPYLATVVMAGAALSLSADPQLRAMLIPSIAAGACICACALDVAAARATPHDDGWRLDGVAKNVVHGGGADWFVIAASSDEGPLVLLLEATASGVSVRGHRRFDGLNAADLNLNDAHAAIVLARGDAAEALIERVIQHAVAYLAAEAVGLMGMLLEATLDHLRMRQQFGQPLGKFQALQHRAAEMLVSLEQARSMSIYAVMMIEDPDDQERRKAFSAIKTVISNAARFVGQNAVQLHGGIGLTEEHRVGWGLRRLTMIELSFGDADSHVARLADLGGFVEPA